LPQNRVAKKLEALVVGETAVLVCERTVRQRLLKQRGVNSNAENGVE